MSAAAMQGEDAAPMVRYGKRDKRVALYLRVSTGEQTTRNQRRELEAVAKRHDWAIAAVFEDAGISGAKGRKDRPGLDAMLKAVARREVDLIMAWSVDRLGGPSWICSPRCRSCTPRVLICTYINRALTRALHLVGRCFK